MQADCNELSPEPGATVSSEAAPEGIAGFFSLSEVVPGLPLAKDAVYLPGGEVEPHYLVWYYSHQARRGQARPVFSRPGEVESHYFVPQCSRQVCSG